MRRISQALSLSAILWCQGAMAQTGGEAAVPATASADAADTSTDFLSDDAWRRLPREVRRARSRAQMLSRYEPSGSPAADRLDQYIDRYRQINIYDARIAYFKVHSERVPGTTGTIKLIGEVSLAQYKSGLQSALENLTFTVAENNIKVLPGDEFGEEKFAISTTSAATMRKEPREQSEQLNSVAMGGMVRLLRTARADDVTTGSAGWRGGGMRGRQNAAIPTPESGQWLLAQSADGYVGFMRANQMLRSSIYTLPDAVLTKPTTVSLEGDELVLPMGTQLHESAGGFAIAPDSRPFSEKLEVAKLGKAAFTAEQILELSKPLLGVRYVWGGVTSEGIDCSGFTQFLWRTRGITLPRDAEEQATVGQIVAWGTDVEKAAQPGDLIYFVGESGKVVHVAVSLGGKRIIHSSRRDVHLSELDEKTDDPEDAMQSRIIYARRVQGQ